MSGKASFQSGRAAIPSVPASAAIWLPDPPPFRSPHRDVLPPAERPPSWVIEPGMKKRLARGRIAIDGRLDLHGMRQVEAREALERFIAARSSRGDRTILVITGKGLKRGDDPATIVDRGVLRAMLPVWLSGPNLAPMIAGWDSASAAHGGDGAFYVRLRRPPK